MGNHPSYLQLHDTSFPFLMRISYQIYPARSSSSSSIKGISIILKAAQCWNVARRLVSSSSNHCKYEGKKRWTKDLRSNASKRNKRPQRAFRQISTVEAKNKDSECRSTLPQRSQKSISREPCRLSSTSAMLSSLPFLPRSTVRYSVRGFQYVDPCCTIGWLVSGTRFCTGSKSKA